MRAFPLNILISNLFFGLSFLAGDRFIDRFALISLGGIWLIASCITMGEK